MLLNPRFLMDLHRPLNPYRALGNDCADLSWLILHGLLLFKNLCNHKSR